MKMIYRCICMVLGAILGTGCSDINDPEYGPLPMPEYGVPTGSVSVTGRVVTESGDPIPGVEVGFGWTGVDTTDVEGNWDISRNNSYYPCEESSEGACIVEAKDIDGEDNGGPYPLAQVELDLIQTESPSGSYDLGKWEQHNVIIEMIDADKKWKPRDTR